jgi:hypothetical protein
MTTATLAVAATACRRELPRLRHTQSYVQRTRILVNRRNPCVQAARPLWITDQAHEVERHSNTRAARCIYLISDLVLHGHGGLLSVRRIFPLDPARHKQAPPAVEVRRVRLIQDDCMG